MKAILSLAAAMLATTVSARSKKDMFTWQSLWHLPWGKCEDNRGIGNATFTQLIDHQNPGLGTFEQFYYYDTTYWKGPGKCFALHGRLREEVGMVAGSTGKARV